MKPELQYVIAFFVAVLSIDEIGRRWMRRHDRRVWKPVALEYRRQLDVERAKQPATHKQPRSIGDAVEFFGDPEYYRENFAQPHTDAVIRTAFEAHEQMKAENFPVRENFRIIATDETTAQVYELPMATATSPNPPGEAA